MTFHLNDTTEKAFCGAVLIYVNVKALFLKIAVILA